MKTEKLFENLPGRLGPKATVLKKLAAKTFLGSLYIEEGQKQVPRFWRESSCRSLWKITVYAHLFLPDKPLKDTDGEAEMVEDTRSSDFRLSTEKQLLLQDVLTWHVFPVVPKRVCRDTARQVVLAISWKTTAGQLCHYSEALSKQHSSNQASVTRSKDVLGSG